MEYQMDKIIFLIALAWIEGGKDMGDPTLKRSSRSTHATEIRKLILFIWYSIYRDSVCSTIN